MLKRARLVSLVLAVTVALATARPARAEPPSRRRWIPVGILYALSATGLAVAAYGVSQIELAPGAPTLGQYHYMANSGATEMAVGGLAFGLLGALGTMVMLVTGPWGPSRSRGRAQLAPASRGLGLAVTF